MVLIGRHAVAVGVLAALFASPGLLGPLNLYDSGLASSAGTFLAHGVLPYRDFWWLYGPAGPILSALATLMFGPSIVVFRLVGLLIIGGQAAVGYVLLRPRAPHLVAAVVMIGAVGAASFVLGVDPTAWSISVLLALLGLLMRREGRDSAAGFVLGFAFLARFDVGGYALIAALLVPRRRDLFLCFGVVVLPAVVFLLLTTPLPDLVQQVIWYPLIGVRQFRAVPPPRADDFASLLPFVALVIVPKVAVAIAAVACLLGRSPRSLVPLILFGALCQLQSVSRADLYHQAQAAVPGLILLGLTLGPAAVPERVRLTPAARYGRLGAFTGLAATCVLLLILGSFALLQAEVGAMPASETGFVAGVRTIRANTTRDEPVFVALTSNRITLINPMLVYYLADRRAGAWATMDNPGVTNTDAVQQRTVDELRASRTEVLYLDEHWADAVESTNESAIPGSTILDTYLAATYITVCDYGSARIVATRERALRITCAPVRDERLLDVLAGTGS
jgi:hypothetical protein